MSFKAEVIADSSGEWCGNALVFKTREEAEIYVADLMRCWTLVIDTRVVETDAEVNYRLVDGVLCPIDEEVRPRDHAIKR